MWNRLACVLSEKRLRQRRRWRVIMHSGDHVILGVHTAYCDTDLKEIIGWMLGCMSGPFHFLPSITLCPLVLKVQRESIRRKQTGCFFTSPPPIADGCRSKLRPTYRLFWGDPVWWCVCVCVWLRPPPGPAESYWCCRNITSCRQLTSAAVFFICLFEEILLRVSRDKDAL